MIVWEEGQMQKKFLMMSWEKDKLMFQEVKIQVSKI